MAMAHQTITCVGGCSLNYSKAASDCANSTDPSDPTEGLKSLGNFIVTDSDSTWIASLMPLGALFGGMTLFFKMHPHLSGGTSFCFVSKISLWSGPIAGYVCTRLGRRFTMFFIATLFALSYLTMVAAVNVWMLFIGRRGSNLLKGSRFRRFLFTKTTFTYVTFPDTVHRAIRDRPRLWRCQYRG